MRLPKRRRAGMALIELLMLLLGLGAAMALGTALLLVALRANSQAATALLRMTAEQTIADRFRHDVAAAEAVLFPPDRDRESTVSGEIVLRRSDTEQITYRFDNGRLIRVERVGEKVTRVELAVGPGCRSVSFRRGEGTVTMRLQGTKAQDITAAVGGDRK